MDVNAFIFPDNKTNDSFAYILDPLSVIIKLAIISNKPIGTKIYIDNHTINFQEPGIFQAVCRIALKTNKTDIQYLYNPINVACNTYLTTEFIEKYPSIKQLFISAQNGLLKLKETYKNSNIICICFNYFHVIISNYVDDIKNTTLFRKDNMSVCYTDDLTTKMEQIWIDEKIKIVLNLASYLSLEHGPADVKSLETIMDGIDYCVKYII